MTASSAFAVGPLIIPELSATNAALVLLAATNIFGYSKEVAGNNMGKVNRRRI